MLGALLSACGPATMGEEAPVNDVGTGRQLVQAAFVDIVNETSSTYPVSMLRSLSNDVFAALLWPGPSGTTWGGNCGATFISPHYAITAAHCVDASTTDGIGNATAFAYEPSGGFTMKQIDTRTMATDGISAVAGAAQVAGTSCNGCAPSWTTPQIPSGVGYNVTTMTCKLTYRCDSRYGSRTCAPISGDHDIALVHCPSRTSTNYVGVSSNDPTSGDIFVRWFHEILNLMTTSLDNIHTTPANNWWNYGLLNTTQTDHTNNKNNYHYTNYANNQLLPLQFVQWPGGTKYKIVAHDTWDCDNLDCTWTDVPGCHGTSGSGVFVNGTSGLLGPILAGASGITGKLCFDMNTAQHGGTNMSYLDSRYTKMIESSNLVQNDRP